MSSTRLLPLPVGKSLALAALLFAVLPFPCNGKDGPIVQTPSGSLLGTTMTSRSGKTIYAFRGLRYAQSPVGELRFKDPVPARESWNGVKNATEYGASCPQDTEFVPEPKSEDCLFLNVFSTKLPEPGSNPQRPVIFWIHHGAWFVLSGMVGPQYLMDEDVVLVSINYRLGALGFLSTGDSASPGNYGLKDQALALEWVRDNIASFGGDPNLVTIFGYSAGAASVQYHMASPRSAGLFHRAISASGSALSAWAFRKNPNSYARRQAGLLSCPNKESTTSREIVECIRGKDANEIAKTFMDLVEWQTDPLVSFAPVIEEEGSSENPFLTKDPLSIFKSGNFNQVPWMTGFTSNEMMTRAGEVMSNITVLEDLNHNFETVAPIAFYFERNTSESIRKSRILREFYFGSSPINQYSLQPLTDLYTDATFLHGADRSVKLVSAVSRSPVYYYQFVYRGRYGHMPTEPGLDRPRGPVHHDDLIYIFYGEGIFPFFGAGMPETIISQRLVKLWANFARTGNPTPDNPGSNGDKLLPTTWIPHTSAGLAYMEIGENMTMKRALRQERAAVWEQIYPMNDGKVKA